MTVFLLQARLDPLADRVWKSLSQYEPVRVAIGSRPVPVHLASVDVVVVWSAAAAELGWACFAALLLPSCNVFVVQADGIAFPAEIAARHTMIAWREGETIRLSLEHSVDLLDQTVGPRPDGQANLAKVAAGVVAAMGVLASGAGPQAPVNPVAISRRESTEKRDAGIARTVQAETTQRAPAQEMVIQIAAQEGVLDLDALIGWALPTPSEAATALVEAMMKPAPVRLAAMDVPKRRTHHVLPGMSPRIT